MRVVLMVAVLVGLCGCGKKVEEASSSASGTVTLDGDPLTKGTLNFYPVGEGNSAFAVIKEDGSFTVDTSAGTVGLEPGEYNVVISYEVPETEDAEGNLVPGENPIPAQFRDEENPQISITVSPGGNSDLKIELSSAG